MALNVEAEFAVNSFSKFTITWNNEHGLTTYLIDTDGNQIGTDTKSNISEATSVSDLAPEVPGYKFSKAVIYYRNYPEYANQNGTEISRLRYSNNRWQAYYREYYDENWHRIGDNTVYFIYEAQPVELTTVNTVDSTSKGVYMYMFDYSNPADIGGGSYGDGSTKLGLATKTTSGTGMYSFPRSTKNGNSFSQWFNPDNGKAANNLFLDEVYKDTGYFYYNAFEKFASFNKNSGDFTVYEQLGSPDKNTSKFYFRRGNFMPYNTLNPKNIINRNLYDSEGQALPQDDPRYNEPIYGFNEGNNFYFGMYIYAQFYQPKDGLYNGQEMVFNFTGDDDMWVYIDGVLVLDLGGIHDAQSGSINFTTGKVKYTMTANPGQDAGWQETTIYDQFAAAESVNKAKWDPERTHTFADGTMHTIQIFYMERGAGASNLKMNFNLPTIPDGTLSVRKNVENYFDAQMKDIYYVMQLSDENGVPMVNEPYTIFGTDIHGVTDAKGQFQLKHDQTAMFSEIGGNQKVNIKEVDILPADEHRLDEDYNVSFTVTDGSGEPVEGGTLNGGVDVTMPPAGSASVTVNNRAKFTAPVTVTKHFQGTANSAAPAGFDATFTVYEVNNGATTQIGSVKYSDFKDGSYTFWLEEGKTYRIEETVQEDGNTDTLIYRYTTVKVDNGQATQGTVVDVNLPQGSSVTGGKSVTYTNVYGLPYGDLSIIKRVTRTDGAEPGTDDFRFQITIQNSNGLTDTTVNGQYEATLYSVTFTGDSYEQSEIGTPQNVTFNQGVATVTLKHGQMITISELPAASKAVVQETNTDGYSVQWTTGNNEMVTQANATVTSSELAGEPVLICTNTTGAVLPSTGGMGTTPFLALGTLLTLGAGMLLVQRRRKEGSDAV